MSGSAKRSRARKAKLRHQPQFKGHSIVGGVLDEMAHAEPADSFGTVMHGICETINKEIVTPFAKAIKDITNVYSPPPPYVHKMPSSSGVNRPWSDPEYDVLGDYAKVLQAIRGGAVPKQMTGNPFLDARSHYATMTCTVFGWAGIELSVTNEGYIGCSSCEVCWCEHIKRAWEHPTFDAMYMETIFTIQTRKGLIASPIMVPVFAPEHGDVPLPMPVGYVRTEFTDAPVKDHIFVHIMRKSLSVENADDSVQLEGTLLRGVEGMHSLIAMVDNFIKGFLSDGQVHCQSGSHWRNSPDTTIKTYQDAIYWLATGKCKYCAEYSAHVMSPDLAPVYESPYRRGR